MKIYFIKNKVNGKYWEGGYRNDFGYSFSPWRERDYATIYLTKADVFSVYKRGIQEMEWESHIEYKASDIVVVSIRGEEALRILVGSLMDKLVKIEEILVSHKLD